MVTFVTLLASATKTLSDAHLPNAHLPDAQREARLLLQHASGLDSTALLLAENDPVSQNTARLFEAYIQRRLSGEPVFRIIGRREFHGMDFHLNAETLEPRDDTETLVEAVLAQIEDRNQPLRFADIGTGTGIIPISLLAELGSATAFATDTASHACEAARMNGEKLGYASRLTVVEGNWFEPLCTQGDQAGQGSPFDFIVSNPPYIATNVVDGLSPEVLQHDPRRALDGGEDGLDAYRVLLDGAAKHLNPHGFLALEIGFDQKDSVIDLARTKGWALLAAQKDLGGQDRALIFAPREQVHRLNKM
ncbi:MAG: peptide chain release factor N(5)-glutamine methyltransferase [Pseudomonadota bacterium]